MILQYNLWYSYMHSIHIYIYTLYYVRYPGDQPPILRYPLMGQALNKTGRRFNYMCNFPWQLWKMNGDAAMGGAWTPEFCNSWRTCGDPGKRNQHRTLPTARNVVCFCLANLRTQMCACHGPPNSVPLSLSRGGCTHSTIQLYMLTTMRCT